MFSVIHADRPQIRATNGKIPRESSSSILSKEQHNGARQKQPDVQIALGSLIALRALR